VWKWRGLGVEWGKGFAKDLSADDVIGRTEERRYAITIDKGGTTVAAKAGILPQL